MVQFIFSQALTAWIKTHTKNVILCIIGIFGVNCYAEKLYEINYMKLYEFVQSLCVSHLYYLSLSGVMSVNILLFFSTAWLEQS
jgi:hypothetical protein